jgi:hypothetical protein
VRVARSEDPTNHVDEENRTLQGGVALGLG